MKILVVQAKGNGGFAEPQTSAYISSVEPSAAPDNDWVRNLIEKDKVELLDELGEKSDWETFIAVVNKTPNFVWSTALAEYRASLGKRPKKGEEAKSAEIVKAEEPKETAKPAEVAKPEEKK